MARKSGGIRAGALGGVIESLYAAALDESLWHSTLGQLSAMFGGDAALLVRARGSDDLELTWIQEQIPAIEGRWDHYMAYRNVDVRTAYALRQPLPTIYVDQQFIDDRGIDRHPFYQEFLAYHGLYYTVGSRFAADDDEFGLINVFRNRRQGHHERPEVELMEAVLPHLSRACLIDQRLVAARRGEHHLRNALDQVPDAIFLLTGDSRIVEANRAAEHLLRMRNGLSAPQSQLRPNHAEARQGLAEAIAAAAMRRTHPSLARALPLPRPAGRPLQALVMPMPRTLPPMPGLPSPAPLVMLVVSDPDRAPQPLPERLAVLWNLTPAESRLASALASGASVKDYAQQHRLTENTVRWTVKCLLAKTDCRRQSELIALLVTAASSWFPPKLGVGDPRS